MSRQTSPSRSGQRRVRHRWVPLLVTGLILLAGWLEVRDAWIDLEQRRQRIDEAWAVLEGDLRARAALATRMLEHSGGGFGKDPELRASRHGLAGSLTVLREASDRAGVVSANLQMERAMRRFADRLGSSGEAGDSQEMHRVLEGMLGVEHRLALHRTAYNEAVQRFNIRRSLFPANLAARLYGVERYPHYLPTDLKATTAFPVEPAVVEPAAPQAE